ncbi:MAG TPA: hypothetical protein PKJ56_00135 [Promineifilum sp.]|nr:hypothetical protein [Promineifilum sp.]
MDKKEYVAPRITSFSNEEILAELGNMQGGVEQSGIDSGFE